LLWNDIYINIMDVCLREQIRQELLFVKIFIESIVSY